MMAGVPADLPPVTAHISGFSLLKVNQTTAAVARGGSRALCQAIPFTAMRVRVRWTHARRGQRLVLDVTPPGHAVRSRAFRVAAAGAGARTIELTPRGEGLRGDAFAEGRYRFTVRLGQRRLDRTSLRLTGGATC
jgi:hypothetical protein